MVYGFDQCRMCGKKISIDDHITLQDWEMAQRRQLMPEKEWRRRGFLSAPTKWQLDHPWVGCCPACGVKQFKKHWGSNRKVLVALGAIVVFSAITWWVFSYAPYNGIGPGHLG